MPSASRGQLPPYVNPAIAMLDRDRRHLARTSPDFQHGLDGLVAEMEMETEMKMPAHNRIPPRRGDVTSPGVAQRQSRHRPQKDGRKRSHLICALALATIPTAAAQSCVSLAQSTQCAAFNASSISTDSAMTGMFPFLSNVTDAASFDSGIQTYIATGFTQQRYQQLIGCSDFNSTNTTDYYARYTTSVLCNTLIQNSITPCNLTGSAATPLCADSCAEYAESEEDIASSSICGTAGANAMDQIRADFTTCALPADSLTGSCITAESNQPDNCGYSSNLEGLCTYCAASSPNATDSCCVFSSTGSRCANVDLPVVAASSLQPLFTSTSTGTGTGTVSSTGTASSSATTSSTPGLTGNAHSAGLTGGQIAGVVVGSVLGAFLLLALLVLGCVLFRRRKHAPLTDGATDGTNEPKQALPAANNNGAAQKKTAGVEALPGGRVSRISALEGASYGPNTPAVPPPRNSGGPRSAGMVGAGLAGAGAVVAAGRNTPTVETPRSQQSYALPLPVRRNNSISSDSAHGDDSPGVSSPEGTGQSEQLNAFKDYYSQDEIHPGDLVSTLWAYQPRANDEFELERGDMIKITGIWDDGWATGVRVRGAAEDWKADGKTLLRDSGMSGTSSGNTSPASDSEVKAFPLVCVCLPQHWRSTIDGDSAEGTLPAGPPSTGL